MNGLKEQLMIQWMKTVDLDTIKLNNIFIYYKH